MARPEDDSLDPVDWPAFRDRAHAMLEAALDRMQDYRSGPVWQEPTPALKAAFSKKLPVNGRGGDAIRKEIEALLPYGVGNTHPRFFGWVHGSGTPGNLIAETAAAAMNANLGGRDHGAIYVEKQVLAWCRDLFEFPSDSGGLIVSGTSVATIIALKAARDRQLDFENRKSGIGAARLVGYTSTQTHACVARAFDILGLGTDALRKIPVNSAFEIDISALEKAIEQDLADGLVPFAIIGTAGSVDTGAIDDLETLADVAQRENLWFHVDGAFGAFGVLSDKIRPRLKGVARADSLAFDFHKWMHVNYDAGCVLIRDEATHRHAFSDRPDYLQPAGRGLAAGNPWPVEYGPELSRGFRALKIWAQFAEHGTEKLGRLVTQNCEQAAYLCELVSGEPSLELLAPVAMNICCFRYRTEMADDALNALNDEIVIRLQTEGIAAPSTTTINGARAIRVNITNHRTQNSDLDMLVREICRLGDELLERNTDF